jgi:hypothetical protein
MVVELSSHNLDCDILQGLDRCQHGPGVGEVKLRNKLPCFFTRQQSPGPAISCIYTWQESPVCTTQRVYSIHTVDCR